MKHRIFILAVIATIILQLTAGSLERAAAASVPAFPGAAGFGTDTPGGRGGKVLYVTNLNDSGAGSLRAALEASGARTVLFRVSGTITLKSDIDIKNPFLTVAGQTAPGEGVQVRGAQIKIQTHDVVIRYLKVRSGDGSSSSNPADRDAITINPGKNGNSAYNIVVDHSTMIWGPDIGGITFLNGARDATVSYSIIGEGLYASNHPEGVVSQGGHSLGINITELNSSTPPTRISVHHNLITTSGDRNPRVIGGVNIDIVNNVIYNWETAAAQGNPRSVNLIGNTFLKGPMTTKSAGFFCWKPKTELGASQRANAVYEAGNACGQGLTMRGSPSSVYTNNRFSPYSLGGAEESAAAAYERVVAEAGANRNVANASGAFAFRRDAVDQRIISNLVNRKGSFLNGVGKGGTAGYPAISWPELAGGPAAADGDNDGMPDAWEQAYFGNTNRGSATNSSGDLDGDGYTDLEEYLNGTDPTNGVNLPSQPTAQPTQQPTAAPTQQPTVEPTAQPTADPTAEPTSEPTAEPTQEPTPPPASGSKELVFKPSDDATVTKSKPGGNFGKDKFLIVDDSPTTQFFIKFNVSGLSGKVTSAKIRLFCKDSSGNGGKLKLVKNNNWNEGQITWKNRPDVVGDVVASLGQVKEGNWYELDVTSLITGDGTYSFRLHSPDGNNANYFSKDGNKPPELVVTVQ